MPDSAELYAAADRLLQEEHTRGLHERHYQPRGCAACWPGGAPPFSYAQAAEMQPDAHAGGGAPDGTPRTRRGMQSLGSAIANIVARRTALGKPLITPDLSLPPEAQPQPVCSTCRGGGWLRREVPVGHPEFGVALPCPACRPASVLLEESIRRDWQDAPRRLREFTLEGLARCSPAHWRFVHEDLLPWLDDPHDPWMILYGPLGVAKTGAAAGLGRKYMQSGHTATLAVVTDLLARLRRTYGANPDGSEAQELDKLNFTDLLVLDDLGKQHQTGWAADRLFSVLNYRYNEPGRRTIITCNEDPIELGERLGMEAEMQRAMEMAGQRWIIDCAKLPNLRLRVPVRFEDDADAI
jgi:DNA replication protein DnaC